MEAEWEIEDFQVRIGIDTGLAALGGQTEAEDTVMGRVVNLAVRIESAAPPGGLFISHNTYRHVRGVFNVEPQEPITAKGFLEPVPVYLVKEIKPRAFRVQTRGVEGVETHMVGRHDELRFLQDALMTAFEEGEGHVVTVSGEAGVGKSRLLYEFDNWLELLPSSQTVLFFQGWGRQETQGSPYSLLRDVFAFRFQILDDDTGKQAREKIEDGFGEVFGAESDGVLRAHILGQLLGFDFSASPHLKAVFNDAEQLHNRGLMYLIQYFQELSHEMPVVIFLEDIHWADDISLDMVSRIGEFTQQHPILIVCASRPNLFERRPYWGEGQTYHSRIELHPLSKRESRQLVEEILKLAADIPADLRELIVRGAEGNPFYTEELIKMLIEDGVVFPSEETWEIYLTRLEQVDIPSTLAGVLQARLDSLPVHERTVLQQASVVGRLFWDRIVTYIQAQAGSGDDPQLIQLALTSLRNRELVYRHEESAFIGAAEYLFKHDVLREVTYESVIKRLRKTYHELVADWLTANSSDRIGEYSGLIAEHLLSAGRKKQACESFSRAGDSALASYANTEAEQSYRQALDLSPRDPLRAGILSGLGEALYRQGQFDEAKSIWQQAIHLYQESGNSDKLGEIYASLSRLIWISGDYLEAWNTCREGLRELDDEPDSPGHARLLAEGGRAAFFAKAKDQVVPFCLRAQEMAEGLDELELRVEASNTLALYGWEKGDVQKAFDLFTELVSLTEAEGLLNSAHRAHHNLADCMSLSQLDLKKSIFHHKRAAEIARQIGDIPMTVFYLQYLAGNYIESGEIESLDRKLGEFLHGFPGAESMVKEVLENSHPGYFHSRGEWILALEQNQENLNQARELGNMQVIFLNNLGIAHTLLELNRFNNLADLSECESVLIENCEIKNRLIDIQTFYLLAIMYTRQGLFSQTEDWLSRVEDIFSQHETHISESQRSNVNFEIAYDRGHWTEAVTACEESLEIFQIGGYRWRKARTLIDLGDAFRERNAPGDLERARETYQHSLQVFSEMGAPGYIKVLEERLLDIGD
jgi:tetratricopeptide (TPR) repeat protein